MPPAAWIDALWESGLHVTDTSVISGGTTGTIYRLSTSEGPLVAKIADHTFLDAEYDGLQALRRAGVSVPEPILVKQLSAQTGCLVMSYIQSEDRTRSHQNWDDLLNNLKKLHETSNDRFGWHRSNYIGTLVQLNDHSSSWQSFFFDTRLNWQLKEGIREGSIPALLEKEFGSFRDKFGHYLDIPVSPSLLHGDLWSGNSLFDVNGKHYLIDPSICYGHWEVDIAMMQLFGGFPGSVIGEYLSSKGALNDRGLEIRIKIYQLYYLIVHLRMFGNSYLSPVRSILAM